MTDRKAALGQDELMIWKGTKGWHRPTSLFSELPGNQCPSISASIRIHPGRRSVTSKAFTRSGAAGRGGIAVNPPSRGRRSPPAPPLCFRTSECFAVAVRVGMHGE